MGPSVVTLAPSVWEEEGARGRCCIAAAVKPSLSAQEPWLFEAELNPSNSASASRNIKGGQPGLSPCK